MNLDTELKNPILSDSGTYLVYGNDDAEAAECLDARTGRKLWSRPLKDFDEWHVMRFINDSVVLMGQENRFEFVRSSDGTLLTSIPIIDEGDWGDLKVEATTEENMEHILPYVRSNIGIYYFGDGTQILDLEKRTLMYQTDESPSKLQYKDWGNVRMIFPRGGADSIWLVDYEKRQMIYSASTDDHDLNESFYQPFAMNTSEIILFNEDNVESIDIATRTVSATMPVETGDADYLFTCDLPDGLHLLVSDDDMQTFYRTKDGKQLWQTPKDSVPGIIDQLVDIGRDHALLFGYHDDYARVYKVNLKTGDRIWSRVLFKLDDDLETGHKEGSKLGAALKTMAVSLAVSMLTGTSNAGRTTYRRNPSTGLVEYYRDPLGRSNERQRRNWTNSVYNSFLSRKKDVRAYMNLVTENEEDVVIAVAGEAYDPANEKMREADGEGVFTINLADGSLKTTAKARILAEKDDLNAYSDMKLLQLPNAGASALVGVNDVYVERKGAVERIPFADESVTFIASNDSTLIVMADNDEEEYHYWLIDAKTNPSTLYLLARSDDPNLVFADTNVFEQTLTLTDMNLTAYPLTKGKPGAVALPASTWALSEEQLDEMEIGRIVKNQGHRDPIQGIRSTDAGIYLMGDDGIAFISTDGSCKWSREWSPNRAKITMPPTVLHGHTILAVGDEVQVIGDDCSGSVVAEYEIDFGDRSVLTSPDGVLLILDADEGLIYGFNLDKASKR